jgi:membrane protein implicated in regulation of membrane protease activity
VTDLTADQVVERCRAYWIASGVSTDAADEMAAELHTHLSEGAAAGKSVETVTGPDIEEFAEEWAVAFRGPKPPPPGPAPAPVHAPPSLPRTDSRAPGWALWLGALAIVALVTLVAVLAPRDETYDQTVWVGLWLVAAALLAVGEMLTAGFFLLPFAIGAAAAGVLALATVSVPIQLITFVVVSVGSLFLLQQFARRDIRGELLPVGAARYIGSSALVVEPVSRLHGTGWVKMGTEDWRATTDGDVDIPANTEVRVTEVRGARLVVEPVDR